MGLIFLDSKVSREIRVKDLDKIFASMHHKSKTLFVALLADIEQTSVRE